MLAGDYVWRRKPASMSEALRGLKDEDLGHLAHYLARFGVAR